MAKIEVEYTDYLQETLDSLTDPGLLLVSMDGEGKPNAMTIGWGVLGMMWGSPGFLVLVRPSRFTHQLMEQTGDFTVNVLPREMAEVAAFCGSVSGRDRDKFAERGLTATPSKKVKSPIIEECVIHYECRVVHKNKVLREMLDPEIDASSYPQGDYHTIYFGEIVSAYADEDARSRLAR